MGPALPLGVRLRLDGVLYWSCPQPARTEMAKRVCRWLLSPVISVPRPAKLGFPTNLVCSYHTPTVWGQGSSLQHFVFILTSQFHVLIIRSVTQYCLYTSWYHLVALTRFCKFPFSFHKTSVPPGSIIDFKPTSLCPRLVKILLIACITTIFFFLFIYFFYCHHYCSLCRCKDQSGSKLPLSLRSQFPNGCYQRARGILGRSDARQLHHRIDSH